jgi:pimeloyl-ACP methyl ester carboxylesterase
MTDTPAAITLADGRRLAYLDAGDPDGRPVLCCHGGLSSRLDVLPAWPTAEALGVRLISPDRPGIGGSEFQPARVLLDWPGDVEQLVDHLGIDQFSVLGWSAGGMYAQACAYGLQSRVRHLGLVASVIPPDWPGMMTEINGMDRSFIRLSTAGAPLEKSIFSFMRTIARHTPDIFAKRSGIPPTVIAEMRASVAEGLLNTGGAVQDYRLLGESWGFEPSSISVPTDIWQGTADHMVPTGWGQRLADAIAGSRLTVVQGGTHFLMYEAWEDILLAMTQGAGDGTGDH